MHTIVAGDVSGSKNAKKTTVSPNHIGMEGESKTIPLSIAPRKKTGNNPSHIIVQLMAATKTSHFLQWVEIFSITFIVLLTIKVLTLPPI